MAGGAGEAETEAGKWWEPIVEFGAHLLCATIIFLMLAGASLALAWIVHLLNELWPVAVDPFVVSIFKYLENGVLVVDVILYAVYVVGSVVKAIKTLAKRLSR